MQPEVCREPGCGKPVDVAGRCAWHYEVDLAGMRLTADGLMFDGARFVRPSPEYREQCADVRKALKGRPLGGVVYGRPGGRESADRSDMPLRRDRRRSDASAAPNLPTMHPEERERLERAADAAAGGVW